MKKISLCLLFVSFIILSVQASELQYSEIPFNQLMTINLSNYQIEKQIKLKGTIIDFDIAKDTGDLVVVEESTNNNYTISNFDNQGNIKWNKNKQEPFNCEISDYGNIIIISSRTTIEIYNQNGKIISSKEMTRTDLLPSSDGKLFYPKTGMMSGRQKEMIIYDQQLIKHKIQSSELEDMRTIRYRFVASDRILAYIDGALVIFSIKDYRIELLGKEYVDRGKSLGEFEGTFHYTKTDYSKYFTGVVAYNDGLYVFNMDGDLVYRDETPYYETRFIDDYKLIASNNGVQNYMKIIDLENNQEQTFNFAFHSNSFGTAYFDTITKIKNYLFCNVNKGPSPYCFVINLEDAFETIYSLPNYSFYKINNSVYVIVESNTPEILVLKEKDD
ncbi:MAG: hypothetical protein KAS53_09745 [Candidatus Cloacimonetes bacterium]|nr:hypothetical protein [Candidatus Cloacimonadota bacterium]